MTRKRCSTTLLLTFCCALSLLLASCGNNHLSTNKNSSSGTLKLAAQETATGTSSIGMTGDFIGADPTQTDWIGMSANGNHVTAFTTDGTQVKAPTFAQWFRGNLQNGHLAMSANNGDHLTVNVTQSRATGMVTLKSGKSFPFTALSNSDSSNGAGLYSSMRTVNGTQYLAGWILAPNGMSSIPSATVTPGATGTTSTSEATVTPGTSEATVTPGATSTVSTSQATVTPSATGTAYGTTTAIIGAGAVINERTGQVMKAPAITSADLASKQVSVPNLGTFNLRQCQKDMC